MCNFRCLWNVHNMSRDVEPYAVLDFCAYSFRCLISAKVFNIMVIKKSFKMSSHCFFSPCLKNEITTTYKAFSFRRQTQDMMWTWKFAELNQGGMIFLILLKLELLACFWLQWHFLANTFWNMSEKHLRIHHKNEPKDDIITWSFCFNSVCYKYLMAKQRSYETVYKW